LVTTIDAAMQRLAPREVWDDASLLLKTGDHLRLIGSKPTCCGSATHSTSALMNPAKPRSEARVLDIFPAGAEAPYRLDHENGRIVGMRSYDRVTQRTTSGVEVLRLDPASELIVGNPAERFQGIQHWLPSVYGSVETVFVYAPRVPIVLDPEIEDRRAGSIEQIREAYESQLALQRIEQEGCRREPLPFGRLYLGESEWEQQLGTRAVVSLSAEPEEGEVPRFAEGRDATGAFGRFLEERLTAGDRVVLAAGTAPDLPLLARTVERKVERRPGQFADWDAAVAAPPGTLGTLRMELSSGFAYHGVAVVTFADLTAFEFVSKLTTPGRRDCR
jgi:transcription-repair coupling factor (superfamily II helicase)